MNDSQFENKVMVNIYGEEYPITGVSDPSYISRVADFVDSKMKETAHNSRAMTRDKIAILAAMSIASELYEKKESLDISQVNLNKKIDSILKRIESTLEE
ncbi:MAG: cell division protein ZapA [FCB group bacterium]|nr:cell division protein ZapA [FCB group bacterium]